MKEKKSYIVPAICLSVCLLLVALFSLFWILSRASLSNQLNGSVSAPMVADIYQNGGFLQSIPLKADTSSQFTIIGENGCYNEVTVKNGAIAITEANCPDKLCIHQGYISNSLLPITCLPNRVVIQVRESTSINGPVTGADSGSNSATAGEIDAITY